MLSSPSGAGKTTITKKISQKYPNIKVSISHTTRKPRPNEIDGVDYHFVSQEKFEKLIRSACGNYAFIFRMRPSDSPAWTLMCRVWSNILINQKSRALWNYLIILQSANLDYSITITSGEPGAIEIKLAIVLQFHLIIIIVAYLRSYPCALCHGSILIRLAISCQK